MKSRHTLLSVVTVAFLGLTGCSAGIPASTEPVDGGILTIGESSDTVEMDPATSYSDVTWRLQSFVYETLTSTDATAAVLPGLAESWEQASDTTWVFHLRPGVVFANGRELTADDVVGSLERVLDPATGSYWIGQMGPITSVTATDAATVTIELSSPWSTLPAALANISTGILPIAELEDGSFDPTTDMLGTGPFQLASHTQDQEWVFEANPEYWDKDAVSLDGIDVKILTDDASRTAALRDGSVDIAYFPSPDAPALLAGIPNVEVVTQKSSDSFVVELNSVNPDSPFVDPNVRTAFALALDKPAIIATALAGSEQETGISPVNLPGSCDPTSLPNSTRDVDKAAELFAAAGVTSFDLVAPTYLGTYTGIASVIQQNMKDAGVDITISTPEMGAYIEDVFVKQPGEFDAGLDYAIGYLDASMVIQGFVVETTPTLAGMLTSMPGLADASAAAIAASDETEKAEHLVDVCTIMAEQAQVIPLSTKSGTIAVRTDQVDADIAEFDGYDIYLRGAAGYSLVG